MRVSAAPGWRGPVARVARDKTIMLRAGLVIGMFVAGLAAAAVVIDAAPPQIVSRWRTEPVAVDGVAGEWKVLERLDKLPLSAAFTNDDEALYACLTVSDPGARMQIARGGLVVYVDPKGGTKKQIGFRFPVADRGSARGEPPPGFGGRQQGGRPPEGPPPEGLPGEMRPASGRTLPIPEEMQRSVEVLGPGKNDRRRFLVAETSGFQARLGSAEGQLVLELRMPLAGFEQQPWQPRLAPGTVIGVRLETAKLEDEGGRGPLGGREGTGGRPPGGGGGGIGGGIGGGRGGMGGMPPGGGGRGPGGMGGRGGPDEIKPFGNWYKVRLAAGA